MKDQGDIRPAAAAASHAAKTVRKTGSARAATIPAPRIVVDGDNPLVDFVLPAHSLELKGWDERDHAQIYPMRMNTEFVAAICRRIIAFQVGLDIKELDRETKAAAAPDDPSRLLSFVGIQADQRDFKLNDRLSRRFILKQVRGKQSDQRINPKEPCLRCAGEAEDASLNLEPGPPIKPGKRIDTKEAVFVQVLGLKQESITGKRDNDCRVHVQIGIPAVPEDKNVIAPGQLAQPALARVIVASLWEVCPEARIRRSLSYEAVALDLLRDWRDYGVTPTFSRRFHQLLGLVNEPIATGGPTDQSRKVAASNREIMALTWVVVRLNSSAILVYHVEELPDANKPDAFAFTEQAHLYFHRERPAPLDHAGLGSMYGYNGIVGACMATAISEALPTIPPAPADREYLSDRIGQAVRQSLLWQKAYFDRGLFDFFFEETEKPSADPAEKPKTVWKPKTVVSWKWRHCSGYLNAWFDAVRNAKAADVLEVRVPIPVAVSHRNQWFIARNQFLNQSRRGESSAERQQRFEKEDAELQGARKSRFIEEAVRWLTDGGADPGAAIPILEIGQLKPVDRREVEDFLALYQALVRYASETRRERPLNIAVFGPPGAGKSFGVKAISKQIAAGSPEFSKDPLTFNFSQFTSLADLVGAFHTVRNECLKGVIPVVFLDEFDSAFEGRPFGWLKYFLAPMQDGEFNEGSTVHRLGNCVLVFAGGINRSFEEFNGRLRNPSFVEAKGPDFISRLRAHLNVRGINRPEDESNDQDRYILRRALMLYSMIKQRLTFKGSEQAPKRGFMHPAVAKAFCEVEHFKHGARSLEAILDMCDLERGRPLGPSDLPAKTQLDMHVDATKFFTLIYDSLKE